MAKGAFQTSREIFENPIWTDVVKFRIFFYIYGNAVFASEGTTIAGIHLKRGQYLRSFRNLQKDLAYVDKRAFKQYSLSTIKDKVDQLTKEGRIKTEGTDYGTLFTVVNYEEYQGFDSYRNSFTERQPNSNRTATERQPNNNNNDNNDNNVVVDDDRELNFFQTYQEVFGVLNSLTAQKLNEWANDLSPEIVNEALVRSGVNNAQTFGYTETILKAWSRSGVKTLNDVLALDAKREQSNQRKNQTMKNNHSGSGKSPDEEPRLNTDVSF